MSNLVDSTTRSPLDFFHFGMVFFGLIIAAAGVITASIPVMMLGGIFITIGLLFFLISSD